MKYFCAFLAFFAIMRSEAKNASSVAIGGIFNAIEAKFDAIDKNIDALNTKVDVLSPLLTRFADLMEALNKKPSEIKLIPNTGTAGSSSVYAAGYLAKYAFMSSAKYWCNAEDQFPAAVWMQFPSSHVLAKIGYLAKYDEETPPRMEVIGSDDCSTWTILLNLENIVNSRDDQFNEWSIPSQNRLSFSCFGLRWPAQKSGGNGFLYISQITMWELK